ncbi:MAG: indolepyruvate ferredoxin oxidoreductase subunit alpha [Thermoprotei archaeon]|nr:MAG: indolepyruvate ferredoxin oxidoreductase subunit alpha [Thermoprotei archaeon]
MSLARTIGRESGKELLLGNEAIARGAIEAGVAVAAAYPGTPSTEIVEALARVAKDLGIYVEWSTNEKVAFEVAYAAATAGARSLTAMKHVGLNVAADPFFSSAYTGVEESFVIVSADDPGMWSSQNEQDNRIYGLHAYIPVIEAPRPKDLKDVTKAAFELSSELKHPVMLRSTTRLSHTRVVVELGPIRRPVTRGRYIKNPSKYVLVPAHARRMRKELVEKWGRIERRLEDFPFNAVEGEGKQLIVASGVSYSYVREALEYLGLWGRVKVLKLSTPVPLPRKLVLRAVEGVEKILVVEELEPVVEDQLKRVLFDEGVRVEVRGKDLVGYLYEMTLDRALSAVAKFLGVDYTSPEPLVTEVPSFVPSRPPQLCPGCPYRPLFYVLRRIANMIATRRGKELEPIFTGDIGCYTLGMNPPFYAQDTTICMGASIGFANGLSHVLGDRLVIAVIGDSTFFHAGIPPLVNAVYNGAPFLVVVLDNRITAMTGHQPHPGTGMRATGEEAPAIRIEDVARAVGVEFVEVVDPFDLKTMQRKIMEAVDYIAEHRKPAVVVVRRACALLAVARARAAGFEIPRYVVDLDKCTGCGICYTAFACPAISQLSLKDKRAIIDPELCTGCGVCAVICPFDAIRPEKEYDKEKWESFWR